MWQIYKLPIVRIPTNKPCVRVQSTDRLYANEDAKFAGIVQEIQRLHDLGHPILIGTRSVNNLRRGSGSSNVPEESPMLSGDENIVD